MTMKGHHERLSRCWGGDSEAGGKQEGSGPSSQPAPLPSPMVATAQSPGGAERRAVLSSDLMQGLGLKLNVYWEDTGDTEPENQVSSPRKLLTREDDPSVNR